MSKVVSEFTFLVERVNIFFNVFIWSCYKEYNNTKECISLGFLPIKSSVRISKCVCQQFCGTLVFIHESKFAVKFVSEKYVNMWKFFCIFCLNHN